MAWVDLTNSLNKAHGTEYTEKQISKKYQNFLSEYNKLCVQQLLEIGEYYCICKKLC